MEHLARYLLEHRDALLVAWRKRARQLAAAEGMSVQALEDHVPRIIEALADAVRRVDDSAQALTDLSQIHASQRWAENYDLRQVVAEYRLLRRVILDGYRDYTRGATNADPDPLHALAVLNENLDQAIADAVEQFYSERMRGADWAIAVLGHDLRNPLNLASLQAQLLLRLEPPLEPQARGIAQVIRRTTQTMERLVADLLDVARWRGGRTIPLAREPTDLRLLVETALTEFRLANPDRDLQLDEAAPCEGSWDPDRLMQVLSNLLGNAIKYGQDPVRCLVTCEADTATVTVRNAGGMPEAVRDRIFKPFFTSDQQHGTGLGLFIAREIARAHGGDLALAECGDTSTCFLLSLPRAP